MSDTERDGDPKGETSDSALVPVVIFGQTYNVRAEEEFEYVEELARFVDTKMREIADVTGTREVGKIAILAALNVADELRKLQASVREDEERIAEAARDMIDELTESLREPTETSPAAQ